MNQAEARSSTVAQLASALAEFAAGLVASDGGELWIVKATAEDVHLHLAGTCAGCPGSSMTRDRLLEPVVSTVVPKATVRVTTGYRVPGGAVRVHPVR